MDLTVAVAQQFRRFIAAGKGLRLIKGETFRATAGHTKRWDDIEI